MNPNLLSCLENRRALLRKVPAAKRADRSAANVSLADPDILAEEAERHAYFFNSGADTWFQDLGDLTFSSTFCKLAPSEAQVIVAHWEDREREKEWTSTHLVSYTWVQDEFLPNPERYPIKN